jgi:hypothetical protein
MIVQVKVEVEVDGSLDGAYDGAFEGYPLQTFIHCHFTLVLASTHVIIMANVKSMLYIRVLNLCPYYQGAHTQTCCHMGVLIAHELCMDLFFQPCNSF